MDGTNPPTIETANLLKVMNELEADLPYMNESTKKSTQQGLMFMRWVLTEVGVDA